MSHPSPEAFFLDAGRGSRFCLFYPARSPKRSILYIHPFLEEMNKSRRMAALQSRAFAGAGFPVLQIDLLGCGDSSGDFGEATWEAWLEDVAFAARWLQRRVEGSIYLWGLRLGATLAVEYVHREPSQVAGLLLWHPVTSGETYLRQILRLQVASASLAGSGARTIEELRRNLERGEPIEIGGYELNPALALSIDRVRLADRAPQGGAVRWWEMVSSADKAIAPASQQVVDTWVRRGVDLVLQKTAGDNFWSTQDIIECSALISATTGTMSSMFATPPLPG
jgi:exosortase A-associated hydrolase 2